MFGWDFEVDAWSRFLKWNLIKICIWSCDMNSTLGSVVPLAMFSKLHHHRYLLSGGLLRSFFLSDLCRIFRSSPWIIRFHTILFPRVYLSKYISGMGFLITFSGLPSPLRSVRCWPIPSSASDFKQTRKSTRESARAAIAMLKITQIFHCHALWNSWILVFQIKFYRVTHNFSKIQQINLLSCVRGCS